MFSKKLILPAERRIFLNRLLTLQALKCGQAIDPTAYMYMCAVKLKIGPLFAFFEVKHWSMFCVFLFLKISLSLRKEELKKHKKNNKHNCQSEKNGPILLRSILGPVFNLDLDLNF